MKSVVKLFIDFEKEEKWLNKMAAKGLNLVDYTFCRYLFEESKAGEYVYRIELLEQLPSHPESKRYIDFMQEMGIECVATYFRWVFFRKKVVEGRFDLYSDRDSRIKHYKRICTLLVPIGILNLTSGVSNIDMFVNERNRYSFSMCIGALNIILGCAIVWLFIKYSKKINAIKKEKDIYE